MPTARSSAKSAHSSPSCARRAWWRIDAVSAPATPVADPISPASTPATTASGDLGAPLYVAWQITNECNLACLHCIEESGPGKAFNDELDRRAGLRRPRPADGPRGALPVVLRRRADAPPALLRDGRVRLLARRPAQDRDQRPLPHAGELRAPEGPRREGGAGEPRRRLARDLQPHARARRVRPAVEGIRNLRAAGVPIEINFSPTRFNVHEIGAAVDLACELGAYSFYTGRTMYTGNAVKTWRHMAPSDEQYDAYFATLHAKTDEYRGRMRVHFHEMGLLEELRYRLHHPAALLIVLPNGLVKLINALPFVCGDLRRQSLRRDLGQLPARVAAIRASRHSSTTSRVDPGKTRDAAPMGPSLTSPPARDARRDALAAASAAARRRAWCATASSSTPGCCPTCSARPGPTRSQARSTPPSSGAGSAASCSRSSASRRSTNTSTRAWAPTACSIPTDVPPISDARVLARASPPSPARSRSASTSRCAAAGRSSPSRCWAALAAIFYEAPPIRWSYRGLGEAVIALSYGPWMVLGSLYLHTRALSWGAFWASLVPGLLIMALAVVNAIPDFHQDRLVGKRNLVVRLGRERGGLALSRARGGGPAGRRRSALSRACFPSACLAALLALPLLVASARCALAHVRVAAAVRAGDAQHGGAATSRRSALFIAGVLLQRLARLRHEPHRQLRAPLLRLLAAHARLRPRLPALLHRFGAGQAPARRARRRRGDAGRGRDRRNDVPYVMLCGGEPLVVPHFFALAEALGAAGVQLKIETNGQRFDAAVAARLARLPIRSIQVSLDGDTAGGLRAPAAGRLAREGARRVPRGARRRPAARDHLRADAAQHPRGAAPSSSAPARSARSASIPAADAHRHRRAALGQARARRRRSIGSYRDVLERQAAILEGELEFCYVPFTMAGRAAREPAGAAGDAAGAAERLGEGRGGAAAGLRRPAARFAAAGVGGVPQRVAGRCADRRSAPRDRRRVASRGSEHLAVDVDGRRLTERRQHERIEADDRRRRRPSRKPAPTRPKPAPKPALGNAEDGGRFRAGDGAAVHPLHLISPGSPRCRGARSTTTARPFSSPGSSPTAAARAASPAARNPVPTRRGATSSSRDEALELARRIVDFGIPYVAFGGGEPLGVPHCWEIFELLAAAGVALKLETDGSRIDDAAADRLAALDVQCVQISVDGATAATHERVRPGSSFAAARAAIERLAARGRPPQFVFVPTRLNLHEIVAAYDLAGEPRLRRVRDGPADADRPRGGGLGRHRVQRRRVAACRRCAARARGLECCADRALDLSLGHRHRDGAAARDPAGDAAGRAQRQGEAPERAAVRAGRPAARFAGAGVAGLSRRLARGRGARVRRALPRRSGAAAARERDLADGRESPQDRARREQRSLRPGAA